MAERFYSNFTINDFFQRNISTLKPSNVPDEIGELFLNDIFENMDNFTRKDIKEMLSCFSHQEWTATSLMAFRIIEDTLKLHIRDDLQSNHEPNSLQQCIHALQKNGYSQDFLHTLDEVRIKRNESMHGEKRLSPGEAKEIVHWALLVVLVVYNYY